MLKKDGARMESDERDDEFFRCDYFLRSGIAIPNKIRLVAIPTGRDFETLRWTSIYRPDIETGTKKRRRLLSSVWTWRDYLAAAQVE